MLKPSNWQKHRHAGHQPSQVRAVTSSSFDEQQREAIRARLIWHYPTDRAAALYGYWQLMSVPGGSTRLRTSLGPAGYRETLAALAAVGIDVPRLAAPGPAAGIETQTGPAAPAELTVARQLVRQARLDGLFGWGGGSGTIDLTFVRAGAAGYSRDVIVAGARIDHLLPTTYHRLEVRTPPALLDSSPPVLLRFGTYSSETGGLRFFASLSTSCDSPEVAAIFGGGGPTEAILYRCYDGPLADNTTFMVSRGLLG
jgi:hypothetical protein